MLAASLTAAAVAPALAADDKEITVNVNGTAVAFEDQTPVIENDRTLVPVRGVFEAMGAQVDWNEETASVTVAKDDIIVVLTANDNVMTVTEGGESKETELDAAAQIMNDRMMIPLRAISEAIGAEVSWDGENYVVDIVTDASTAAEALAKVDNTKWQYNADDGVYWQVGIQYCANPAAADYETLGIFVPAGYMNAADNGDGTFTCTVNSDTAVGAYTALTAPIVIPVNTPGYSAMSAPTGYVSGSAEYTKSGFVYVNAGCRGRDSGAPSGVTDLKAAIRYIRYNADEIAGSTDRIFTFGMSGGGAQSALVGATGNSDLYEPYLEAIGAVSGVSDAVAGSMCWCPITNLDVANEAYEWNMGMTREGLDDETQTLSDGLAEAFAEYINAIELKDADGNVLTLAESESGIYMSGTYYDYLKSVIEGSLNNFLADTEFPYSPQSSSGRGGFGGGRIEDMDGIARNDVDTQDSQEDTIYQTAEEYIASLNSDREWISYDADTNTASISSIEDFASVCKKASKSVGAFDDLNGTQGENVLFGYADGSGAHFDPIMAELLKDTEYGDAYAQDLTRTDALGNTVDYRMNMYNPMYYLDDYYGGVGTSDVAKYWRIRTGINQGDTALATEVNLSLALAAYGAQVDFETVWGQAHVEAERTGDSTSNFISWVNECLAGE